MHKKDKLGKNPYVENLLIKVKKTFFKGQISKDTGEAAWMWIDASFITSVIHIPKNDLDNNGLNINDKINLLPPNACKLLYWIMRNLRYGEDNIYINPERYCQECEVSLKTFRLSLKVLCHECFLAKSQGIKFRYWINPNYIYCGKRTSYIDNIVYPDGTPDNEKLR